MADTETTTSNNATSVEVVAVGATLAAEAAAAVEPAEAVAETVVATAEEERAVEMVAATAKAEIVEEAGQPEAPPAAVGGVAAEPCPQEEARQSVLAWLNRTTFALSPGLSTTLPFSFILSLTILHLMYNQTMLLYCLLTSCSRTCADAYSVHRFQHQGVNWNVRWL